MSCESCIQKAKEQNEAENKTIQQAQELANQDGYWYAIYTDETGTDRVIRADFAQQYPVKRYVSPQHT